MHPMRYTLEKRGLTATLAVCIIGLLLASCTAQNQPIGDAPLAAQKTNSTISDPSSTLPTATAFPTNTPVPTPTITPTPIPIQWEQFALGVERAYVTYYRPGVSQASYIYTLRIDPGVTDIRVHYDPVPHTIDEWQTLTNAPIVFNGGFFGGDNNPVGRIISDGSLYGVPLDYGDDSIGVSGLFTVRGHNPQIFTLGRGDFNPQGMRFDQAVESYPVLLLPGGQPTFPEETGKQARRTVIAIDEDGYVIVMVSDVALFSLYSLSEWLPHSGLRLDTALNLDGGRSTGLVVNFPEESVVIPDYVPLPIVVAVYPR